MTFATVITDASFCPRTKSAAWAAWVRCDGVDHAIKAAGGLRRAEKSDEAEKQASLNGIVVAKKFGATRVLLQTDCMATVHLIQGVTKNASIIKAWNDLLRQAGLEGFPIYVRHVKAHSGVDDPRSFANEWCDKVANKVRRGKRVKGLTGYRKPPRFRPVKRQAPVSDLVEVDQ